MEGNGSSAVAKRLWHIVRVVYYMIRKGLSKRKLMMELHLLLKRGKIAGKAIGNLMFHHHHHHDDPQRPDHHYSGSSSSTGGGGYYAAFTCRSMDPNLSYYNPREVEFSCSNTPSYPFHLNKRKRHHHHRSNNYGYDYDVATVRKALEIINSQLHVPESPDVMATPSPAPFWGFPAGKSPMLSGRQLRITDSPFPIEEEGEADGQVDSKAEEFIKHFYEQLQMQKTPSIAPRYRSQAVYG
ncbi:hypothetical protein Taro_011259 [Colocasia esculenta]|uniref:Avr9/Cf-9 rapidly elicited protein 146 n=1 Tax=Colocasia esculenta TaxID=4460 RepID=A0A843U9R0_COLES|nr:hypothetical protein [Colocasia esculenta]